DFGEIDRERSAKLKEGEMLAVRPIDEPSHFEPEQYQDDYRQRVLDAVNPAPRSGRLPRAPTAGSKPARPAEAGSRPRPARSRRQRWSPPAAGSPGEGALALDFLAGSR